MRPRLAHGGPQQMSIRYTHGQYPLTFISTLKGKPERDSYLPWSHGKNGEFRVKVLSLAMRPRDSIKRISQSLCFFICKVRLSNNSFVVRQFWRATETICEGNVYRNDYSVRELGFRRVKWRAHSHTASKQWSQGQRVSGLFLLPM